MTLVVILPLRFVTCRSTRENLAGKLTLIIPGFPVKVFLAFLVGIFGNPTGIFEDHGRLSRKSSKQKCKKLKKFHACSNFSPLIPEAHALLFCEIRFDNSNSKLNKIQRGSTNNY